MGVQVAPLHRASMFGLIDIVLELLEALVAKGCLINIRVISGSWRHGNYFLGFWVSTF